MPTAPPSSPWEKSSGTSSPTAPSSAAPRQILPAQPPNSPATGWTSISSAPSAPTPSASKPIELLASHGVDTAYVQLADYPTGQVNVTLDNAGKPTFEIAENTAWDHSNGPTNSNNSPPAPTPSASARSPSAAQLRATPFADSYKRLRPNACESSTSTSARPSGPTTSCANRSSWRTSSSSTTPSCRARTHAESLRQRQ